jgi:long-chain acyl-CoA synthetase
VAPPIVVALAKHPLVDQYDLSSLEQMFSGAAPLSADLALEAGQRLGCEVVQGYGMTELSPVSHLTPPGHFVPGSVGLTAPNTEVRIMDPVSGTDAGQGEDGEVCIRGPQVMKGYWQRPEDTAAVFVDGALRTGDIGYLDDDGYLFLVDRIKDVIICGGYNVYPRAIEDAAYQHPAVKEAIAIAVPDPYRGQSPKLFVAPREGMSLTVAELEAFLDERISKIEMPHEFEIRPSLPRTLVGKLSKKELVEEERRKRA